MKVSIEHGSRDVQLGKKRLFGGYADPPVTYYDVTITVDFSEEERAILTKYGLWTTQITTKHIPELNDDIPISIKNFEGGWVDSFTSLAEARAHDAKARETFLPQIKALITGNRGAAPKSDSFEL
jgi:hypothetical protein